MKYATEYNRRFVAMEQLESRAMLSATLLPGFTETQFVAGFDTPTSMEFAPDGRLFVAEKAGDIRVVQNGKLLATPFLSLNVMHTQEAGIESVAFDPNYAKNHFLYVWYTDPSGTNRLSRFTANPRSPNAGLPRSEVVMLTNISPTGFHNGGAMHFGRDGMLYLGIGEGQTHFNDAQDLSSLFGKILRLNVDAYPNIIPSDNPFVNTPGARGEIYAYGFRNPFTSGIDPITGTLMVNDVGKDNWEEVDKLVAGGNYGWPTAEGNSTTPGLINPIYTYSHDAGEAAITGGTFYRGRQFPRGYQGQYFFSDYLRGFISYLDPSTGRAHSFARGAAGPVDLNVGPDGALYYLSVSGDGLAGTNQPVMRISYNGAPNQAPTAVMATSARAGKAPLTVSFSGAKSSDPLGDPLSYVWNFGDGSKLVRGVAVKHVYQRAGAFNATLTVADGRGASDRETVRIVAGTPRVRITSPLGGTAYRAGQLIRFAGSAISQESAKIAAEQMDWRVVLFRGSAAPVVLATGPGGGGSFRIPAGAAKPGEFCRIYLSAVDGNGVRGVTYVNLWPA